MSQVGTAASELLSTVRALLGFSRPGRLREQMGHVLELVKETAGDPDLENVRTHLVDAAEHYSRALARHANPALRRRLDWGGFLAILVVLVAPAAALGYVGYRHLDSWWGWLLTATSLVLAVLFFIAAIFGVLLGGEKKDDDTPG